MISNFLEQKQKQKQNAEESRTADTGLDYNCSRRGGGECWIGTGLLWQPPNSMRWRAQSERFVSHPRSGIPSAG